MIPPSRCPRLLVSCLLALVVAWLCYYYQDSSWYAQYFSRPGGDFFWALRAARDLLAGHDPYRYPFSKFAIPYPLTTALFGLPFASLPDQVAAALFFGASTGFLAFGLLSRGYWPLVLFLSPAFWQSFISIQFVPLLLAIPFLPWLLPLVVIKPQIGLPIMVFTRWHWVTLGVTGGLVGGSFIVLPDWPLRWLSQLGMYNGFIPLYMPIGIVLLLALLRWRDQRAWWFLFLTMLPQQRYLYDQLIVWLLPQSLREMLVLTGFSWAAYFLALEYGFQYGDWLSILFIYMPMLGIILVKQEETPYTNSYTAIKERFLGFYHRNK